MACEGCYMCAPEPMTIEECYEAFLLVYPDGLDRQIGWDMPEVDLLQRLAFACDVFGPLYLWEKLKAYDHHKRHCKCQAQSPCTAVAPGLGGASYTPCNRASGSGQDDRATPQQGYDETGTQFRLFDTGPDPDSI